MRLCVKCIHYDDSDGIVKCGCDHWIVNDRIKSKIFNPMMFECIEYEGVEDTPNFGDDHLFDLLVTMSK